jgi:hypothetical protein
MAADKMGMGLYIPVKAFFPVYHPHGYDGSLFPEKVDITVYRGKGQIGDEGFELVKYPLGAGM